VYLTRHRYLTESDVLDKASEMSDEQDRAELFIEVMKTCDDAMTYQYLEFAAKSVQFLQAIDRQILVGNGEFIKLLSQSFYS